MCFTITAIRVMQILSSFNKTEIILLKKFPRRIHHHCRSISLPIYYERYYGFSE